MLPSIRIYSANALLSSLPYYFIHPVKEQYQLIGFDPGTRIAFWHSIPFNYLSHYPTGQGFPPKSP